jgi:hypothetical protein
MKQFLLLGLFGSLMLWHSGRQSLEVARFLRHREVIARELCVNRDVPQSCCKGTCQLVQRVQAVEGGADAQRTAVPPVDRLRLEGAPMWREEGVTDGRWSWVRLKRLLGALLHGPALGLHPARV